MGHQISKCRMGGRAFIYQEPLLWKQVPVWIQDTETLYSRLSFLTKFSLDQVTMNPFLSCTTVYSGCWGDFPWCTEHSSSTSFFPFPNYMQLQFLSAHSSRFVLFIFHEAAMLFFSSPFPLNTNQSLERYCEMPSDNYCCELALYKLKWT